MKNRIRIAGGLGLLICCALTQSIAGQLTFDLASDFSAAQNPQGAWAFGWMAPGSNTFNLYGTSVASYGLNLNEWRGPFPSDNGSAPPNVVLNPTDAPITVSDTTWLPQRVTFHPGQHDERSVIRWTSPVSGAATLTTTFEGRSSFATSGVEIFRNGALLFSSLVWGTGAASQISFITNLVVAVGDTIDFRVNYGNGDWTSDTTQISVVIQAVPEPSLALTQLSPMTARLAWPTNAPAYLLETATQLPAALWAPETNQPVAIGDNFVVTISTTEESRFFRLRKL